MRVSYAIHVPTTQYFVSNRLNSESAVKAWIAEQKNPEEYIVNTIDFPEQQWITIKAKLDHVTHNAVLAHGLGEVKVASFGEAGVSEATPKLKVHVKQAPAKLTEEQLQSITVECEGLQNLIVKLQQNLEGWAEIATSSQQEASIRTIKQEIDGAERRLAYLQAQVHGLETADVELVENSGFIPKELAAIAVNSDPKTITFANASGAVAVSPTPLDLKAKLAALTTKK